MKPNFALTLSFDGIGLLRRVPAGWAPVGDGVALDTDDLSGDLAILRERASAFAPDGLRSKLVIPNEQIRYLTIDTPDLPADQMPAAVAQALDGETPYAVADLAFDWAVEGRQTHIAAVAKETLAEAEGFAVEHAFNPVSFVAIAPDGAFDGEPFFGMAPSALGWLEDTDSLSRDMQPIRIVEAPADVAPEPEPESPAETLPEAPVEPIAEAPVVPDPEAPGEPTAEALPEAAADPEPSEDVSPAPEAAVENLAQSVPDKPSAPQISEPETAEAEPETPASDTDALTPAPPAPRIETPSEEPAPKFASIRARRDPVPPAPRAAGPTAPVIPLDDEDDLLPAPPVTGRAPDARPEEEITFAAPASAAPVIAATAENNPAASPRDAMMRAGGRVGAFFSRRGKSGKAPPPPRRAQAKAPAAASAPTAESEKQRMTIFGARKPEKPARVVVGGKPKYLGLILTAVLMLFLAGVAVVAAISSEEGLSRIFSPRGDTAVASLPAVPIDDTLDIEGDEAALPDPDARFASVDPDMLPDDGTPVLAQPALPPALSPEEVAARYAATGIWQKAPDQPQMPGFTQLDDLYIASIDRDVRSNDAIALPDERRLQSDASVRPQASPAAAGTQFSFDARGLVRATPEGAITPDGVRVFAGRPAALPASFPTRFEETPQANETLARLAQFRPRLRPGDLVQQTERTQLGGLTRAELAAFRPRLRPELPKATEEQNETATAQAVPVSVKPKARPGNFSRTVERARKTEEPEVVRTAAATIKPRTVSPKVPSSANVAKQATVRNALNLRKVNLIGVYGKPSSRRALIRMSNGRYKKVKVGDTLDGGRVAAIGDSDLRYTKGGRSIVLKMPRG